MNKYRRKQIVWCHIMFYVAAFFCAGGVIFLKYDAMGLGLILYMTVLILSNGLDEEDDE